MEITKVELKPESLVFIFNVGEPVIMDLDDDVESPDCETYINLLMDPFHNCGSLDEFYSTTLYIAKLRMAVELLEEYMDIKMEYDGELLLSGLFQDFADLPENLNLEKTKFE